MAVHEKVKTNRTIYIQIRVTPEEKAEIKRKADKAGKTISKFMLSSVLTNGK